MPDDVGARTIDGALGDALETALASGAGPGVAAALVTRAGTVRVAAAGLADIEGGRPLTPDTAMAIGSVSKTFTAAAILRLRDAGQLALGDPLIRHVPEVGRFRDPFGGAASATIRDLLQHTAGLPCEPPSPDLRAWDPPPIEDVLSDPARVTWAIPPGSAYKYSNLGYDLLGEVIARSTGGPYAAYITDRLLAPLGMTRTTFGPPGAGSRIATGHGPPRPDGARQPARRPPAPGASSGWWSTVEDLARWVRQQLDADVVTGAGRVGREPHRPFVVTDPRLGGAYGLGWRIIRRGDHVHVGHGGLTTGFEARIEFDPDRGVGVVVLLDGIGPAEPTVRTAAALFAPLEATPPVSSHSPDGVGTPTTLAEASGIVGRFREVGFEWVVAIEATPDGLWIRGDGAVDGPLLPTADPDRYRLTNGRVAGEELVLLRGPGGGIDAINVAGYPMARLPD